MKKNSLVLDIDNTLIHSIPNDFELYKDIDISSYLLTSVIGYISVQRPGLQSFLDFIFKRYNVGIWSAGGRDYVRDVVDNIILIKNDRKLDFIYSWDECEKSIKKYGPGCLKNLKLIWEDNNFPQYTKNNTLIIDDVRETCEFQKDNSVWAVYFDISLMWAEKDQYLNYLIKNLPQ